MTTMLERAARAAHDAKRFPEVDDMGGRIRWDALAQFQRDDRIEQARAVLMAVREPDERTIQAGEDGGYVADYEICPRKCFTAMIDAILNETPK